MARTNVDLDERLVAAGMKMTRCKTKKELLHLALKELVARKNRKKILQLEGKVSWAGDLGKMRRHRL